MNNYIAAVIILPILLFFVVQDGLQTYNQAYIAQAETVVEAVKEEAKQEGYFTSEMIDRMRTEIVLKNKDISKDEIIVDVTTVPKYRTNSFDERELIHYKIGIPIKSITAAHRMFGISEQENRMMYYFKGDVASERLMPGEDL